MTRTRPRLPRTLLLCSLKGGTEGSGAMLEVLEDRREALAARGVVLGLHHALQTAPDERTPHEEITLVPQADLVVDLSHASDGGAGDLHAAALDVAVALSPYVDVSASTAFVGEEVAITKGDGPVLAIMALRRYAHHSTQQFMQLWYGEHADLGEDVTGVRYRQMHPDPGPSAALAHEIGYAGQPWDGIVYSFFDDFETAHEIMVNREVLHAIEDEKRFIDHDRSAFGYYRTRSV